MKRIDFENGNIVSNILKAALPMLVAQIMSLLYNIVDRVYIARIPDVGTTALGAVGLCFPIIVIITAFSNLFGTGGAPIFSIERGKGNHAKAGLLMNTSFTLLALCAVILMIAGLLFARPILVLFGASDAGLAYAYPYLMIYLLGTFPSMAATGMNPFINAQGYATTGMISVIIGAITNLLLDPLFIFVFGLGIKGAAIATVISQTLSAAFVLYFLHYKAEYRIRFLSKTELASCSEDAKNIVSLGTAGFIMQLTNSLVTICANNVLSVTGGDVYISVMTIISSVRQMVETPIYAITEGSSPIISYNYGAGNAKRIRQTFKCMLAVSMTALTVFWLFVQLSPTTFIRIFSNSEEIIATAGWTLRVYMAVFCMFSIQMSVQQTFTALGKAKASLFIACLRKIILLIPLIFILPHFFDNKVFAVFLAEPVSDTISITASIITFRIVFKKAMQSISKSA